MPKKFQNIDLNPEFRKALDIMEKTDRNIFITGRAGTGKSTLLDYFRHHTKKNIVVLAPTGVAAINVTGQTIHSFFGFKPDITLEKVRKKYYSGDQPNIYRKLDAIVIDEISMVRADLMDCIDKFMRLNGRERGLPFGGTQMIFIGDLYQLPPVVIGREKEIFKTKYKSEYFFDAHIFSDPMLNMDFLELEKIYRQKDQKFISLLNAIRNKSADEKDLAAINARYRPDFQDDNKNFYITLTPTNKASEIINEKKLASVKGKAYIFQGLISGDFKKEYLPTVESLKLKSGAQVMMLNNDSGRRWVNGSVGQIRRIEKDSEEGYIVWVKFVNGKTEAVLPHTWEIFNFSFDKAANRIQSEVVGSFTQYPLKLAWSVTIHKSQGKTFEQVVIDIGRGIFAHGQMYVALSRCTTLDGIILKKKISQKNIWMDWRVVKFATQYQYKKSEEELSLDDKKALIKKAIKEKGCLNIIYLKANDIKSRREIEPKRMGRMEFMGKSFLGIEARCLERQEARVFRVDRILEILDI